MEICALGEDAAQLCHQGKKCERIDRAVLDGVAPDAYKALEPPNEPSAFGQRFSSPRRGHWNIKWLWHAQQGRTLLDLLADSIFPPPVDDVCH